ncbi:hypothetical protein FRC06_006656 [Ceratobasidium sp. 370]|nr:hypothetical protein FRC06_006656 [Ceratobasidium sp. 370]
MHHLDHAEGLTGATPPTQSAKVFRTPELCQMIVDSLGRNDILCLQLVSRPIFHTVTPNIWQELPSLLPLAFLLVDRPQMISLSESDRLAQLKAARLAQPLPHTSHAYTQATLRTALTDPTRARSFRFYARLVKTLRFDSDAAKGFQWQVFLAFTARDGSGATCSPLGKHLTRLCKIIVDNRINTSLTHRQLSRLYRCGINRSSTEFILEDRLSNSPWLSSLGASSVLRHLQASGTNLRRLDIYIAARAHETGDFDMDLQGALRKLKGLQELGLSVDAISSGVMAAVSVLPELTTFRIHGGLTYSHGSLELEIPEGSFDRLHTLELCVEREHMLELFELPCLLGNVRHGVFRVDAGDPADSKALFSALGARGRQLSHILFHFEGGAAITLDDLSGLLPLALRSVRLRDAYLPGHHGLSKLVESCPVWHDSLESLVIPQHVAGLDELMKVAKTMRALTELGVTLDIPAALPQVDRWIEPASVQSLRLESNFCFAIPGRIPQGYVEQLAKYFRACWMEVELHSVNQLDAFDRDDLLEAFIISSLAIYSSIQRGKPANLPTLSFR